MVPSNRANPHNTAVDGEVCEARLYLTADREYEDEYLEAWLEVDHVNGWTYAYRVLGDGDYLELENGRVFPNQPDRIPARSDRTGRSHGERPRRPGEDMGDAKIKWRSGQGQPTADIERQLRTETARQLAQKLVKGFEGSPLLDRFPGLVEPRREGESPSRRDDRFLAEVAAYYVSRVDKSRTPRKDTAEKFGYSLSWASNMRDKAQMRGILTPTAQGKAGGELTALGKRLAQQHQAL